jgi:ceramide glucosyltransferase
VQLLLGAEDPNDPALEVARRVAAAHPQRDIQIVAGCRGRGASPMVRTLQGLLPYAKYDILMKCDDVVRLPPDFLARAVAAFADPQVGMSYASPVGVGETTAGAVLENFTLVWLCGVFSTAARLISGLPVVTGKCMIWRRAALEAAGGLRPVANMHCDDYLLAMRIRRAGRRVVLAPQVAPCVYTDWTIHGHLSRQLRWFVCRRKLSPVLHFFEPLNNLPAIGLVLGLAAGVFDLGLGLALLLGALATKVLMDAAAAKVLRGSFARLRHLPILLLKDYLLYGVWFTSFLTNRVDWRGRWRYVVGGSRLVAPEVYQRWLRRRSRA